MNGFLERLVNRSLEVKPPAVQPRLPSWYEPQPALGMPPVWAASAESSRLDEAGLLERNEQTTAIHPLTVHIPGEVDSLPPAGSLHPQAAGREAPGSPHNVNLPRQIQPHDAQDRSARLAQPQHPPEAAPTQPTQRIDHSPAEVMPTERSPRSPRSLQDSNPPAHQEHPAKAAPKDDQVYNRLDGNGAAAVSAARPASFVPPEEDGTGELPQRPVQPAPRRLAEEEQMARVLARLVESERAAHARDHPTEEQLARETLALAGVPRVEEINPPPLVRVQIGRVEVQVTRPGDNNPARAAQQKKHAPRSPVVSLDAYLNERARASSTGGKR